MADQLADRLDGRGLAEPGSALQEVEPGLPATHRGHRQHALRRLAQAFETCRHHVPDARRQRVLADGGQTASLDCPGDLDDHEGIPFAHAPHTLADRLYVGSCLPDQRVQQLHGVGAEQRHKAQAVETLRPVTHFLDEPAEPQNAGQFLLARCRDQQHGAVGDAAGQEGQEPEAQVVGPLHVLENQEDRSGGGEVVHNRCK